eukprot:CAMPEP_0194044312 /NCGR_PEP_ID=MMETSP0009_2-20130614/15808_1 /TAXON_ID=210454 /ORGANISM="Grammatophora oceanica, Strain CCMP 410" /LENGTH=178 /DNA_ID=CAMNT_0038688809 /DNA_START=105 /DNA_END=641 /DNA_ORIENTATION=+
MGCASSTEVVSDPITGEKKEKKKLGGAYPGRRRKPQAPYQPPPSAFQNGQATAHFVQYGGGNALVLADGPNPSNPQPQQGGGGAYGKPQKEFVQVTLPAGVNPGDTIHVQAPSGATNAIIVPEGMYAGSTFTVEFDDAPPPASFGKDEEIDLTQPATATATPIAPANNRPDDFVSGFR